MYRRRKRYRYKNRRNNRKFKRYYGYAKSGLSLASKAISIANGVRSLINVEYKHYDTTSSAARTTTPQFNSLSSIPQGDTTSSRNGDNVRIKSIQLRGNCNFNSVGSDIQRCRIILFRDKLNSNPGTNDPDQTTYKVLDGTTTVDVNSLRYKDLQSRFTILYDKVINLSEKTPCVTWTYYKRCSYKVKYEDSTTQVAMNNNIYIMLFSSSATNAPSIAYDSRVQYIDN